MERFDRLPVTGATPDMGALRTRSILTARDANVHANLFF